MSACNLCWPECQCGAEEEVRHFYSGGLVAARPAAVVVLGAPPTTSGSEDATHWGGPLGWDANGSPVEGV